MQGNRNCNNIMGSVTSSLSLGGGGSVVECRTPQREVGVRNLPPQCCVHEQGTLLPESTGLLPRKQWLRPDMTEKLLTGTLSLNTNKQTSLS